MKKKAIVMAGGKGTRLSEAKGLLNKHTLPVYNRPMIEHVITTLVNGGVSEVLVQLNGRYPGSVMEILEDGDRLGCSIKYSYLRDVHGPGRQLCIAEEWANGGSVVIILGDSLFLHPLDLHGVTAPHMWVMPLNGEDDPKKYWQVTLQGQRVGSMVQKPKVMVSNMIQTTVWAFPADVFERARSLCRRVGDEVHVGMLAEQYVKQGGMTYTVLPSGSYLDLGTPDALLKGAMRLSKLVSS